MKTLQELAQEYERGAENLSLLIEKYTKQMRTARLRGNGNLEFRLKRKIYDMYTQREHMIEIASHLKNYYTKDSHCIV